MKKNKSILTLLIGLFTAFASTAQMNYVQSALAVIKYNEIEKLEETIQNLNAALTDETTKNEPKMWYARARVFQMVAIDTSLTDLAPDAAEKSVEAYVKFFENPTKKSSYVTKAHENFIYPAFSLFQKSEEVAAKGDVNGANKLLEKLIKLSEYDKYEVMKENKLTKNTLTYTAFRYCLIGGKAYNQQGKGYLQKLMDNNYLDPKIYGFMAEYQLADGDTTKAIEYIESGKEIDPTNTFLINKEINLYIAMDKKDMLFKKVNEGLVNEPENSQLYYIRGFLNQELGQTAKAKEDYENAVKFNPGNYDAQQNLALIYINEAEAHNKILNQIDPQNFEAFDKQQAKRNDSYKKALPYLEAVISDKESSEDVDNKELYDMYREMKIICTKLKMRDRAKEYLEKMRSLEAE